MTIFTFSPVQPECFFVFFRIGIPIFFLLQINAYPDLYRGKRCFFQNKNAKDTINPKHRRYTNK